MDDKVLKVLDVYHERLSNEMGRVGSLSPGGSPGKLEAQLDNLLLAVGPESGQLLNIIAKSLDKPNILELGTSYGYSTIWLADAARASGGRLTTIELKQYKSHYAHDMAAKAGLSEYIEFLVGDAVAIMSRLSFKLDLVLVDLWKDLYVPCLEAFYPRLNPGAIIVADNMLRPDAEAMVTYTAAVRAKPGIESILLPVGQGLEISRFSGHSPG